MNKIDEVCADIIRSISGNEGYYFEKSAASKETILSNRYKELGVDFKKVASEIRKAVAPIKITHADINEFIKEMC